MLCTQGTPCAWSKLNVHCCGNNWLHIVENSQYSEPLKLCPPDEQTSLRGYGSFPLRRMVPAPSRHRWRRGGNGKRPLPFLLLQGDWHSQVKVMRGMVPSLWRHRWRRQGNGKRPLPFLLLQGDWHSHFKTDPEKVLLWRCIHNLKQTRKKF